MKIKKNDKVLVIKGKDKGKIRTVLRTFPKKMKILVEGINIVKKFVKPKREGEKGKIVDVSRPIFISKVKLICFKCGKPTRVGFKIIDGKKFRYCKKCNNIF
ncbi:MAG: 50S ribosomal protein L24 [Minisyncoccia bacterium]